MSAAFASRRRRCASGLHRSTMDDRDPVCGMTVALPAKRSLAHGGKT
jgi:hypothetical protein